MALTFDAVYYYSTRPDVLQAFLSSDMSVSGYDFALNHYNTFGWKEGSNPNQVFITDEYLADNPDVKAAGVNPFEHYNNHGQAEGRAPNSTFPSLAEFDAETYLAQNPDLGAAGITTAAAAYDHYITFGWNEGRPGAPDNADFLLAQAFSTLAAAEAAVTDFLEGSRENEYLIDKQSIDATSDAAAVEAAIAAEFTAAATALETSTGLTDFDDRSVALQNQAVVDTRAELQSDIDDLYADIAGVEGLAAAVNAYIAADEAATAANEALDEAGTNAAAALAAFNVLEASTFAAEDEDEATVDLLADPEDVDSIVSVTDGSKPVIKMNVASTAFVLESGVDEASNPGVTELLNTLNAALAADNSAEAAASALADAETALADLDDEVDADTDLGYTTGLDVANAVTGAAGALETFNDDVARFENAKALADLLESLETAVTNAEAAFEGLGYEAPAVIDATVPVSADADLFVFDGQSGSISAGLEAQDAIYFGAGFNVSRLADDFNINGSADIGNVAALDIFLRQEAGNTVIYIENDTWDGQADGTWDGETVTLTGVSIDSVSIDSNGILRITDAIA